LAKRLAANVKESNGLLYMKVKSDIGRLNVVDIPASREQRYFPTGWI
jgi:hypothetical protein